MWEGRLYLHMNPKQLSTEHWSALSEPETVKEPRKSEPVILVFFKILLPRTILLLAFKTPLENKK